MRSANLPKAARAQSLRQTSTDAETKLWHKLRDRRLAGFKFTRQFPAGPYFADFACREAMLIVEADGSQHAGSESDAARDAYLLDAGHAVLRFWNNEILTEMQSVCETILAALEGRLEPFDRFKVPPDWVAARHRLSR